MRVICLVVLAGLASACGDNADESAGSPVGLELADAADGTGTPVAVDAATVDVATGSPAAQVEAGGGTGSSAAGAVVGTLPLRRGFYVAADTACSQASNATLQLLRRDGINTSRTPCDFQRIEKIGATSYRVTESCTDGGEAWGSPEEVHTSTAIYEIESETRFKVVGDSWESSMQYCAQSSLPDPWRDNDISDIVG